MKRRSRLLALAVAGSCMLLPLEVSLGGLMQVGPAVAHAEQERVTQKCHGDTGTITVRKDGETERHDVPGPCKNR